MNTVKKRSSSHVIGEKAVMVLKEHLPSYWVVREYSPDYGIDLSIELFKPEGSVYVTSAEYVYVQVKGTEHLTKKKIKIPKIVNNQPIKEIELDVINFNIDVSLLRTVEKMGSSVPVLLTVVDVTEHDVYFICLNDYIDKILLKRNIDYTSKKKISINIPCTNKIFTENSYAVISWYAKRSKLYSMFSKAYTQYYFLTGLNDEEKIRKKVSFASELLRLDVWNENFNFGGMQEICESLIAISRMEYQEAGNRQSIWEDILELSALFETIAREWFLPTYIGMKLSSVD